MVSASQNARISEARTLNGSRNENAGKCVSHTSLNTKKLTILEFQKIFLQILPHAPKKASKSATLKSVSLRTRSAHSTKSLLRGPTRPMTRTVWTMFKIWRRATNWLRRRTGSSRWSEFRPQSGVSGFAGTQNYSIKSSIRMTTPLLRWSRKVAENGAKICIINFWSTRIWWEIFTLKTRFLTSNRSHFRCTQITLARKKRTSMAVSRSKIPGNAVN